MDQIIVRICKCGRRLHLYEACNRKEKGNGHKKNRRIEETVVCECEEVFDLIAYLKEGKRVEEDRESFSVMGSVTFQLVLGGGPKHEVRNNSTIPKERG